MKKKILIVLVIAILCRVFLGFFFDSTVSYADEIPFVPTNLANQQWNTLTEDENNTNFIHDSLSSGRDNILCITNTALSNSCYWQTIKAKANTAYRLSVWVKTENVNNGSCASISLKGNGKITKGIDGTQEWTYISTYGKTAEDNTCNIALSLGGYFSNTQSVGKAWFKDLRVEEITEIPKGFSIYSLKDTALLDQSDSILKHPILLTALILSIILVAFAMKKIKFLSGDNPRIDKVLMLVLVLQYTILSISDLGSIIIPKSYWQPASQGEEVVIALEKDVVLSNFYHYGMGGTGKLKVEYFDNVDGKYKYLGTIVKEKLSGYYCWKAMQSRVNTRSLKITSLSGDIQLGEIALFEEWNKEPISKLKIQGVTGNSEAGGNLIDEQNTASCTVSYMSGTYFDEVYYVQTAYEFLNYMEPTEKTHPPLGKIIIMLGIKIFGMNPFGWRIMGALVGILMLPLMYLFGKKLFEDRVYAYVATFLMMFDFMDFTQSRIATIDVFSVFFTMLAFYYIYDYFMGKSLKPLFLSGLFWGIGISCKWITAYAALGIGLIIIWSLIKNLHGNVGLHIGAVVVSFICIPAAIYALSYMPILLSDSNNLSLSHILKQIQNAQYYMYSFHNNNMKFHDFQSLPWTWPLLQKPILYFSSLGEIPGSKNIIITMGNPAIWLVSILAVPYAIILSIRERHVGMKLIIIAGISMYIPWFFIHRPLFIYHFFSVIPFVILCIVYCLKVVKEKFHFHLEYLYCPLVLVLFIFFYPVISGMPVASEHVSFLKSFGKLLVNSKWIF